MNATPHRTWNQRRFVALAAALSGLALPVTGFADHLAGNSSGSNADVGWSVVHVALGGVLILTVVHAVVGP